MNSERWKGRRQVFPLPAYRMPIMRERGRTKNLKMSVCMCVSSLLEPPEQQKYSAFYLKTLTFLAHSTLDHARELSTELCSLHLLLTLPIWPRLKKTQYQSNEGAAGISSHIFIASLAIISNKYPPLLKLKSIHL